MYIAFIPFATCLIHLLGPVSSEIEISFQLGPDRDFFSTRIDHESAYPSPVAMRCWASLAPLQSQVHITRKDV
jgi:hypothetical protein